MQRTPNNQTLAFAGAVVAMACAVACASTPLRTERSTSRIRAAEEIGAQEVPQAALHLQLAKEALSQAKSLADDGEDEKANSMLMRAEADAKLAVMLSRQNAERSEAKAAVARVQELRNNNL